MVLGVSRDGLESHRKFSDKYKLPFVLLSDPDKSTMRKYGAWGKKMLYGKLMEGSIRSTAIIGTDGKVLKHWPKVRGAAEHPQEVLEFLKQQ